MLSNLAFILCLFTGDEANVDAISGEEENAIGEHRQKHGDEQRNGETEGGRGKTRRTNAGANGDKCSQLGEKDQRKDDLMPSPGDEWDDQRRHKQMPSPAKT